MWNKLRYDRRVQLLLALVVVVVVNFWTSSRYPSLDTKSMMAGSVSLADGLSFDAWIPHDMQDSVVREVVITFLNWVHTNEQGMLFGLTLAVLFMCLIPLLRDELDGLLSRRFSATLSGAVLGAPLGVCVNCAAPIGYGMYRQGARLEAALATMISSPTMNVVVLSMAFALFPVYIVAIKIFAALFVIFVLVPFLVSRFPDEAVTHEPVEDSGNDAVGVGVGGHFRVERELLPALKWLAITLLRQGWVVVRNVVPVMLLAGFLGAAAVVLLPWDALVKYLPQQFSPLAAVMMVVISAFGLFLPVPIAFDVVLAASLSGAGVSIQYIAILLFVLGSFSIYSFMVLLRAKAQKVAVSMVVALVLVGVATGFVSQLAHDFYAETVEAPLFAELADGPDPASNDSEMPAGLSGGVYQDEFGADKPGTPEALRRQLADAEVSRHVTAAPRQFETNVKAPALTWKTLESNARVQALPLPREPADAGRFNIQPLPQIGLHHHFKPLVYNFINEFPDANGVSAGDFNDDGWFDLLFATANGVFVYVNAGGSFALHSRLSGDHPLASFDAGAAAFVDLDNDGWEDIIFSEHGSGLWIAYNRNGAFARPQKLPESDGRFSKALAFYDLTGDGNLEFFSGHVSSMLSLRPSHEGSRNILYRRTPDGYVGSGMHEPFGETLSIWLGHIDDDGKLDLWIGNDFDEPDMFYELDGPRFSVVGRRKVDQSTRWTMSFDAADIDNDLDFEVYVGQTTWNPSNPPFKIEQARGLIEKRCENFEGPYCRLTRALAQTRRAAKRMDAALCNDVAKESRLDCIATVYFRELRSAINPTADKAAIVRKAELLKAKYPKLHENFMEMVKFDPITMEESNEMYADFVPQRRGINALLVREEHGRFVNRAIDFGVEIGGWTWNARFADLDADEWQDLYVANGWTPSELETTNVFFHNQQGRRFVNATQSAGLLDFEPTISYSYVDYDNDGDLDIISYSQVGRVAVLRNDMHRHHAIQFELRDSRGNRAGIGSRLVIRYGEDGTRQQIREIRMSGGHLSFDPKIAHFGLGDHAHVDAVTVTWSTGETETFEGPFSAAHRYRIAR